MSAYARNAPVLSAKKARVPIQQTKDRVRSTPTGDSEHTLGTRLIHDIWHEYAVAYSCLLCVTSKNY